MCRRLLCLGTGLVAFATASVGFAGEPVAGVDVGAAIPTSAFRDTADVGGAVAPFAGWRFGDWIAVTPLVQPQLAAFSTQEGAGSDDVTSIFSITGGARFSLFDGAKEVYFSAQGGYYRSVSGPLDGDGDGFNIAGGFNYEIRPGTALGLYIRRDQASIDAAAGKNEDLTFLVTGLELRRRFLPAPPPPPPPVVAAAPAPAPTPAPVKKKIVLRGVHFDFDKAVIRSEAEPILDEAARTLKDEPSIAIAVEGYTDSVGTDSYNQRLSVRRAEAVRDYLAAHGIDASRMTVEGFGESRPVASNDTAEGRAQNRRVELRVRE
jgi:outer membrane protein OmpA-like peptidoglycan-associated protein